MKQKQKLFKYLTDDVSDYENGKINYFMEVTVNGKLEENGIIKKHIQDFHTMLFIDIDKYSYDNYVNKVLNTFDTYGLGMSLMYVLHKTAHLIPEEMVTELETLFLRMLHFNVFQRIDPEEANKIYNVILVKYL